MSSPTDMMYLSIEELASAVGLTPIRITRMVRLGLLDPVGPSAAPGLPQESGAPPSAPGPTLFTGVALLRLRRMLRLRDHLGVNLAGAAIIVELLERLERLEKDRG